MRQYFQFLKIERYTLFAVLIFHVLTDIWLNFQPTKTYDMSNWRKFHDDSADPDRFDLATLERELQPRKPVHFYFTHPLIVLIRKLIHDPFASLKLLESF